MLNSSQTMAASYRYDPFGNTISKSGALADANVYRFSSKEIHVNSGMYYYFYRFYDPNLQRWLNRDPLEETGHKVLRTQSDVSGPYQLLNLYTFVANTCPNELDPLGLELFVNGQWFDWDRFKNDWDPIPDRKWGGLSMPLCFFKRDKARNCATEYRDCVERGNVICSAAGGYLAGTYPGKIGGASGGGLYGSCMIAYRKACEAQDKSCKDCNKKSGF